MKRIVRLEEVVVFENQYGRLYNDRVKGPTGTLGHYLRWQWQGSGVIVVPVFQGRFALRRMFRYSPGIVSLEFPGGGVEDGEAVEDAAGRELEEEFGLLAEEVCILGKVYPDTGILEGAIWAATARVADPAVHRPHSRQEVMEAIDDEDEQVIWLDQTEFLSAVAAGEIQAGTTLSAAMLYLAGRGAARVNPIK
jgi:8-oxo-dGTP pyrophosphatase MutT (NUDIX family)